MMALVALVFLVLALMGVSSLVLLLIIGENLETTELAMILGFYNTVTAAISGVMGFLARGLVEAPSNSDKEKK